MFNFVNNIKPVCHYARNFFINEINIYYNVGVNYIYSVLYRT
jgi:hypothetical protein